MASDVLTNDDLINKITSFQTGSIQNRRICKSFKNKYSNNFTSYFGNQNVAHNRLVFTHSNFIEILSKLTKLDCQLSDAKHKLPTECDHNFPYMTYTVQIDSSDLIESPTIALKCALLRAANNNDVIFNLRSNAIVMHPYLKSFLDNIENISLQHTSVDCASFNDFILQPMKELKRLNVSIMLSTNNLPLMNLSSQVMKLKRMRQFKIYYHAPGHSLNDISSILENIDNITSLSLTKVSLPTTINQQFSKCTQLELVDCRLTQKNICHFVDMTSARLTKMTVIQRFTYEEIKCILSNKWPHLKFLAISPPLSSSYDDIKHFCTQSNTPKLKKVVVNKFIIDIDRNNTYTNYAQVTIPNQFTLNLILQFSSSSSHVDLRRSGLKKSSIPLIRRWVQDSLLLEQLQLNGNDFEDENAYICESIVFLEKHNKTNLKIFCGVSLRTDKVVIKNSDIFTMNTVYALLMYNTVKCLELKNVDENIAGLTQKLIETQCIPRSETHFLTKSRQNAIYERFALASTQIRMTDDRKITSRFISKHSFDEFTSNPLEFKSSNFRKIYAGEPFYFPQMKLTPIPGFQIESKILEKITLSGCHLKDEALLNVCNVLFTTSHLKYMDLSDNLDLFRNTKDMEEFDLALNTNKTLSVLKLRNVNFFRKFFTFTFHMNMIDLSHNNVMDNVDAAMFWLNFTLQNNYYETLDISNCIPANQAIHLKNGLKKTVQLSSLIVTGNIQVSDILLSCLSENTSLVKLTIEAPSKSLCENSESVLPELIRSHNLTTLILNGNGLGKYNDDYHEKRSIKGFDLNALVHCLESIYHSDTLRTVKLVQVIGYDVDFDCDTDGLGEGDCQYFVGYADKSVMMDTNVKNILVKILQKNTLKELDISYNIFEPDVFRSFVEESPDTCDTKLVLTCTIESLAKPYFEHVEIVDFA